MKIEVDKIFTNYDFGFDLDLISASNWSYDNGHYHREVYLEDKTKNSIPIPATFHIYLEGDGKIKEVVVKK